MASLKTKFSVGLFLVCGIGVAIVAIIWLGMSNYLEKGRLVVAYFDESVQGLDVDSPVKYRGVHIGRVHQIHVAPDERLIEVVLKIESEIKSEGKAEDFIAQLKSVGITGLMFIEIEHKGDTVPKVAPPFDFTPEYPVIATQASDLSKIFQGMEDIFEKFRALDTASISDQLKTALEKINRAIDAAELDRTSAELRSTMKKMRQLIQTEKVAGMIESVEQASSSIDQLARNADGGVSELRKSVKRLDSTSGNDIRQVTADLKAASDRFKSAMESAASLLQNSNRQVDSLQRQVMLTLNRVDRATETLDRFLTIISNQPSQVIFSRPAVEKPLAPEP